MLSIRRQLTCCWVVALLAIAVIGVIALLEGRRFASLNVTPEGLALTKSWKVDAYLGMPVEATAKNGIVTAYAWNDFLGRLKSIERTPGIGGTQQRTVFGYEDDFVPQRVTRSLQITEGSTAGSRAVEYQYWASDRVKKTKYPSGREVVECLDGRLRVAWASGVKVEGDCTAGTAVASTDAYVTNAEYAAHGALAKWQLGNGLWEVAQFNDRLQMERKRIGLTNAAQNCGVASDDELCLEWGYGSSSANNGNVMEAKQWSKKTAGGYLNLQSTFTYDGRNRLSAFNETVLSGGTPGAWGQTNFYDRYGNRWATGTSQSDATPDQQGRIDAATNRVTVAKLGAGTGAITYDAAGFMTAHPHVTGALSYDGEGRQVASGTSTYLYDGEGRRVRKIAGGVTSWFWYGADGSLVAEDTTEAQEAGRQYLHVDALGSTRLVTRADKSVVSRMDYWPFGEEVAGTALYGNRDLVSGYAAAATVKQRFTGKERDPENGFDYFGARYYAGAMGRWTSPDAPWADQDPMDPQTWNLYMYGRNVPTRFVDPDGKSFKEFWDGMTNAANSNAGAGSRVSGSATDYKLGQRMGDALSIVGGLLEMGGGGSMLGGGAAACGTGVLCAAGAPAIVGGAAAAGHGAAMAANGIANFMGAGDEAPQAGGSQETSSSGKEKPQGPVKAKDAAGQSASGQATDKYGNKIGGSGETRIHNVDHSTKKAAKDAARNQGKGAPMHHPSPKRGDPHYHSTRKDGKKIQDGVHHNYPK